MAYKEVSCCNTYAKLKHSKDSLRGAVIDYIISFSHNEYTVQKIIGTASVLFEELMEWFWTRGKRVKVALVAQVRYIRCTTEEEVVYYHLSTPSEEVMEAGNFFKKHMERIAERIDNLNRHGSSLLIKHIEAIHVQVSEIADGLNRV